MKIATKRSLALFTFLLLGGAVVLFYIYSSAESMEQAPSIHFNKVGAQQVSSATPAITHSAVAGVPQEKVELVTEGISEQFSLVASAYADEMQYPPYSIPLTTADHQLLQPNTFSAISVPLENGASAAIELDAYRFIYPQPVHVQLRVDAMDVYDVSWKLIHELSNKELDSGRMKADKDGFQATLNGEKDWDGQVRIEIEFKHGSQAQVLQVGFEYTQPVAKVVGIGDVSTEAADLIIPIKLRVVRDGTYRLRANLFDVDRKPLAVLSATERLSKGDAQLKLRAYKAVLKGVKGPLWIGTFQLENRSAFPGEPTRYGDSEAEGYSVSYSGNEIFSEDSYQPDAEEQQRLEYLQQMSEQQ
jgi:hypothetical protein